MIAALLGCYFSACTIALKTYSRSRLSELLDVAGRTNDLQRLIDRDEPMQLVTTTIRTSLNFVVLLSSLYFFEVHYISWNIGWRYTAGFAMAGAVVSVFTVAIPISWARYRAEKLLAGALPVLNMCVTLFLPVAKVLHAFDPIVRRISGADMEQPDSEDAVSDEVMSVVEDHETSGKVDRIQKEMIEAVFEFPSLTAEEIMTPRTDIKGIDVTSSIQDVKKHVDENGHSRIPVYEDNLDHIIGILYAKDLIQFLDNTAMAKFDLRQIMRQAMMVPETKSVQELLAEFRSRQVHIAILLDEYGGTAGLISIEDILEELVGEIQDEYEPTKEEPTITRVNETTLDVEGRVHVDDLNDQLDVGLPEDEDYDTVAGFVVATLGRIPDEGETFEFENLRLTITDADRTKVNRVRVVRLEPADLTGDAGHGHGK